MDNGFLAIQRDLVLRWRVWSTTLVVIHIKAKMKFHQVCLDSLQTRPEWLWSTILCPTDSFSNFKLCFKIKLARKLWTCLLSKKTWVIALSTLECKPWSTWLCNTQALGCNQSTSLCSLVSKWTTHQWTMPCFSDIVVFINWVIRININSQLATIQQATLRKTTTWAILGNHRQDSSCFLK